MGRSWENITRAERFKIGGIIGVAVFIVSMMIWSSFEGQIQQSLETAQIFLNRIFNTSVLTYFNTPTLPILTTYTGYL